MQYIIFGAGETGERAYNYLGEENVLCFADNKKSGKFIHNKNIVDFTQMLRFARRDNVLIVVASDNFYKELTGQLIDNNVTNYLVFPQKHLLPHYRYFCRNKYPSFYDILKKNEANKFESIVIYGLTPNILWLLHDLNIVLGCDLGKIKAIVSEDETLPEAMVDIPVVKFNDMPSDTDCLLLNIDMNKSDIRSVLDIGEFSFEVIDLYDCNELENEFYHPELARYKNIHKGQRCFIIGSGPSLSISDLNTLHKNGEICFACNRIYTLYDKTPWRSDYIGIADQVAIKQYFRDRKNGDDVVFIGDSYHVSELNEKIDGILYFHNNYKLSTPYMPKFSADITKGCYASGTVIYDCCMQFAVYMGFAEIYLLGVDFSYANQWGADESHFPGYFSDEQKNDMDEIFSKGYTYDKSRELDNHLLGFKKVKLLSDRTKKFKVYNATRGGKLEVFERVNFDELF